MILYLPFTVMESSLWEFNISAINKSQFEKQNWVFFMADDSTWLSVELPAGQHLCYRLTAL